LRDLDGNADLIVWDSTPAGIIAAIAAARAGLKAIIITEDRHIGGLQTSGLGFTNAGQRITIGGLTAEFHRRVLQYYISRYGKDSPQVVANDGGYFFEPHVAENVYLSWLSESGVKCVTGETLNGVEIEGGKITALNTTSGRRFFGRVFIDASYEGDLLKLARCSYHLGRESRGHYGEPLAGATYPPERVGEGDHKLQPFDYRMCLTDIASNRVPFTEPVGYDPNQYEYDVFRMKARPPARLKDMLPLNWMPNRKTDSRTAEWPGRSWDYIETSRARRLEIEQSHRRHSAGYLWFLMTDSRVPKAVREEAATFGLARDEFTDNGHWPYHIYVREGRRLVGTFVMTQRDCLEDRFKSDSIGLCSWYLDVHPVEIFKVGDSYNRDGAFYVPLKPFEIPYRSLLPKESDTTNLIVPVGLSASHVAFSAIRVEPVWMILGNAAGTAAALSVETGRSFHQLQIERLQQLLREQGQVINARPFNEIWPSRNKL